MRTQQEVVPIMRAYSRWFLVEAQQSGVPLENAEAQVASWGADLVTTLRVRVKKLTLVIIKQGDFR